MESHQDGQQIRPVRKDTLCTAEEAMATFIHVSRLDTKVQKRGKVTTLEQESFCLTDLAPGTVFAETIERTETLRSNLFGSDPEVGISRYQRFWFFAGRSSQTSEELILYLLTQGEVPLETILQTLPNDLTRIPFLRQGYQVMRFSLRLQPGETEEVFEQPIKGTITSRCGKPRDQTARTIAIRPIHGVSEFIDSPPGRESLVPVTLKIKN